MSSATKSYYVKKRKPVDQIWPNQKIVRKTVKVETHLLQGIDVFARQLDEKYALDRKASQAVALGYLVQVGLENGLSQFISPMTMNPENEGTTLQIEMPAKYFDQIREIIFTESTPEEPITLRQIVHRYLALGLYSVSNEPKSPERETESA